MTSKPFSAHCTNIFEETHMATEPRNIGSESLYFSQSQSRKIIDTTLSSISSNPLQNYNVPNLTMNNGDCALPNPCVNYAQPRPVGGGGFLFSFAQPERNYLGMFNTGRQNFNSYAHQQPNYYNSTPFSSHPNLFPPAALHENTQKETAPFKLQFHSQRSTSTSDLEKMKINDQEMAFMKKMTDLHHMWKDGSEICSKLSHFDPYRKYGLNKVLHLTKSPDLKAKKGKFYEIDISQECDICQNNISQTLQLFENEKNGLFVNDTCTNKEKEQIKTTSAATETLTNLLRDESLQTESNVPMDVTDDIKNENKEEFVKNSSISDEKSLDSFSEEKLEEMLNKKVNNLLNYFPKSILRKFRLLENEITNLLLKTMQMSDSGKCLYSGRDLQENDQRQETGLQPKNFDRNLINCLTNKGRAEKRHFPDIGSDDDFFEFQTNKILRLTKSTDLDLTNQNRNDLKAPKESDDENIKRETLSDKSVSYKNSDTKPVKTECLNDKTKSDDSVTDENCISSQIFTQADNQIQKWHDIMIKKLQMFENGIREVFVNTKQFSLNCTDVTDNPVIGEINTKNTDDFQKDTVSYIGNFLDKIITLQKSPDILDKINELKEEVTRKSKTHFERKDSMSMDDRSTEKNSKLIEEKPELIIPEESLRVNHGLDIDQKRVTHMDLNDFSSRTSSKRKLCQADPVPYSSSDYSPNKRANINFERKTVSENYLQGFLMKESHENHHKHTRNKTSDNFNVQKSNNCIDIKEPKKTVHRSSSEIMFGIANDNDDQNEVLQVEHRKSISKIIDDIHTQIWGSEKSPTSKSRYYQKESFDKYKQNHQNKQIDKNPVLVLRPLEFKSENNAVETNSIYKFLEDYQTGRKTPRKSHSRGYGTCSKSKFLQEDNERKFDKSFMTSKYLDDFRTSSPPKSHSRNFEKRLSSKSKFFENFEMSRSIVNTIINKACDYSDAKDFLKTSSSDQKENAIRNSKFATIASPRKSKSLTSINEDTQVSMDEKSTDQQLNLWQKNIPRSFAKENKEMSRSKMYLFDNWRKKLQDNKTSITRGSKSKSNIYQRPSFKKKVPRALLTDDSRTDIEASLESYDKSTREMEKKLTEALQRYNKTAKVTDEITKKYVEISENNPIAATPRTFLPDTGQLFLAKVENVLKAKLSGCQENGTMEPSMSFDDEEIRSVQYSRSYVIQNADDDINNKDQKYSEN